MYKLNTLTADQCLNIELPFGLQNSRMFRVVCQANEFLAASLGLWKAYDIPPLGPALKTDSFSHSVQIHDSKRYLLISVP